MATVKRILRVTLCVILLDSGFTNRGNIADLQYTCADRSFGYKCRFICHCQNNEPCDKVTGNCASGCKSNYWGPGCQLSNNCFYNGQARKYMGTKSVTNSMHLCQRWDSQLPHRHSYNTRDFPDREMPANFCRTTQDSARPWCYTNDRRQRWEHCNINNCNCPAGRFGHNCESECKCADATEACDSIMGMCQSGCAPGWEGFDCQTPATCPSNHFGWDCSKRCQCRNPGHCDRFSGPSVSCQCEDGYFNPPYCEPVTAPRIIYFGNQKVNPSQPADFNCTVAAFPTPYESDITLVAPSGVRVTLLKTHTLDQYQYTRINLFRVSSAKPGEKYSCVVRATAGSASLTVGPDMFELPRLHRPPFVQEVGPTELSIEWPVWTHQRGDTGDPPIMWYSVWVRASTEAAFRMVGRALQIICGDVCNYTINSLTPNTEYAIYVSTKRDGDGGDGPPGPVFYETTRCAAPSSGPVVESVSGELQYNMTYPKTRLLIIWKDAPKHSWNCEKTTLYEIKILSTESDRERTISLPGDADKSVSIPDLEPSTRYCVRVRFQNNEGFFSPESNEKCVGTPETTPTSPRKLSVRRRNSTSLTVTWDMPDRPRGNVTVYTVSYWKDSREEPNTKHGVNTRSRLSHVEYTLTDLQPYTKYNIQVQALNSAGPGDLSDILTYTTDEYTPGPVSTFRNLSRSATSFQLQWEAPEMPNGELLAYHLSCEPVRPIAEKGTGLLEASMSANTYTHTFRDLTSATEYVCTITANTSKGSGPRKTLKIWTEGRDPMEPEPPVILETTESTVTLELKPVSDHTINFYRILVENVSNWRSKRSLPHAIADVGMDFHEAVADGSRVYVAAELKTEMLKGPFIVGDNKTYHGFYNAPLQMDQTYDIWFGAFAVIDGNLRKSYAKAEGPVVARRSVAAAPPSSHVPVIVGVLVVFILLILVFALLLLIWRRRHLASEREKAEMPNFGPTIIPDPDPTPPPTPVDSFEIDPLIEPSTCTGTDNDSEPVYGNVGCAIPPIRVEDLWDFVKQNKENNMEGLKTEYRLIPAGLTASCEDAKKPENKLKNRYGNIIAYDHSRVVLQPLDDDVHDDYTNANYIDGYRSPRAYIAAQGPTKPTINDLWRMTWQEDSKTIIMLTNPIESSKRKCEQYWPDQGCAEYAGVAVQLLEVENLPDFTIRTFLLSKDGQSKYVKQFHYTTWPDHGVPKFGNSLLLFRQKIRSHDPLDGGSVIVHCSAGVGRTGTYISIDVQLEQAKTEGILDVHNFVQLMRTQRVNMVQTLEQYIYVYDCLLEALICGETTILKDDYPEAYNEMCTYDASIGKSKVDEQFEILNLISTTIDKDETTTALRPENMFKNRTNSIFPANRCRPYLMTPYDEGNDYINAVFINSYLQTDAYIVTQMPLPNTLVDFWRLMYDHHSYTIVMLNEIDEKDETCEPYWTMDTCGEKFGPFIVETTAEIKSDPSVTVRDFTITNTQNPKEVPRIVRQFSFHRWAEGSNTPSSRQALLELLEMVETWQQHTGNKAVTVHCLDGASRSGLYIAASCILERLKYEREIDVFQAVKQIRLNRPQLIDNMEQFRFCHEIVLDYLNSTKTLTTFS